ncbi:DUF3375 domain-containing protein [Brachybacterium atlanticum]|uniref:DUF3375 domain-containing protein n=1 Tax=Brachybacterium atlanticum TaxID=2911888 RepID=UPI0021E021D6|nr:DUF3375 domain-containing protein [Brachybacterium atlanticum]
MSGLSRSVENRELMAGEGPLQLLRRDHAPYILGTLAEHLGGVERTRLAADLYDLVDADLEELRLHEVDLPRSAQHYCATWVEQGFLTRRAARAERTEEFSLTEHAHAALRILDQVHRPREAVTRSRLALLTDRLRTLAQDTDPDSTRRIAELEAERSRISALIDMIREHGAEPMPADQALEAAEELFSLALDVPSDFTRVRGALEDLHRQLRLGLVEHDGPQGEILDQLFLGVDAIEGSEAGRSFSAFHAMLIDPVQEARFHEAVDALASRPFAAALGTERVLYLQSYLSRLQRDSHQVRHAMIDLSRSLREFVRSRQFEEFRALADRLRRPQRLGLEIAPHVRPHTRLEVELTLSTFTPRSVGQFRLLSPGEATADDPLKTTEAGTLDLDALRATIRESEIDLAELETAVDAVLATQPTATIGEVLTAFPATQGLASVVGLVVLAQRHEQPGREDVAEELVRWETQHGVRSARLPMLTFTSPPRESFHV